MKTKTIILLTLTGSFYTIVFIKGKNYNENAYREFHQNNAVSKYTSPQNTNGYGFDMKTHLPNATLTQLMDFAPDSSYKKIVFQLTHTRH